MRESVCVRERQCVCVCVRERESVCVREIVCVGGHRKRLDRGEGDTSLGGAWWGSGGDRHQWG